MLEVLLPMVLPKTTSEPPNGKLVCLDGPSRYRGRKRQESSCKQGGTVEYVVCFTPDVSQGWSIFVLPQ